MDFNDLVVESEEKILLVRLNRPDVLNAIREETFKELEAVPCFSIPEGRPQHW